MVKPQNTMVIPYCNTIVAGEQCGFLYNLVLYPIHHVSRRILDVSSVTLLVRRNDGISVDSTEGRGAVLTVRTPPKEPENGPEAR